MVRSLRGRVGFTAVVWLGVAGLLAPLARSAIGADPGSETESETVSQAGLFDGQTDDPGETLGDGDGNLFASPNASAWDHNIDNGKPLWFTVRVNALFLNRTSAPNVVLAGSTTGSTLLSSSQNNPGWAGGAEVDFMAHFTETTSFEANYFSVQDWFNNNFVGFGSTSVNQVAFPATTAGSSVSSQLRNLELNLRQQVSENFTLLAGFRYVEFLDGQGVHFGNTGLGFSEDISTNVTNQLYGFQLGAQASLWNSNSWAVDGWLKAGVYGNTSIQNTNVTTAGIPLEATTLSATRSKTAFVGDLGLRATRQLSKHFSGFAGYRLMFLDGVALAPSQIPGVIGALHGGLPSISSGNNVLFQGIEVGLIFAY